MPAILRENAEPIFEWEVVDENDKVIDITGGTITLHYRINFATEIVRAATITDGLLGLAEYQIIPAELLEGTIKFSWLFVDTAGRRYPSEIVTMKIHPELVGLAA